VEHLPKFYDLAQKRDKVGFRNDSYITRNYEVILELRNRVERIAEKAAEFALAFLHSAFDDVRRNRHRRSNQLAAQGSVNAPAYAMRNPMDIERQSVRLPPDMKFLEIPHAGTLSLMSAVPDIIPFQGGATPRRQTGVAPQGTVPSQ
jgi:hypothetical protein